MLTANAAFAAVTGSSIASLDHPHVSLTDIFAGAFSFALAMLLVLIVLIAFPQISLMIL